jgi:hypothetical protein
MIVVKLAKLTLMLVVLLLLPTARAYAETTLSFEAEIAHRTAFKTHKKNKAMVMGPGGLWWTVYGLKSETAAKQQALKDCKTYIQKNKLKSLGTCELIAVNDKYVFEGNVSEPLLDQPLPLPDRPLQKAKKFSANVGQPKGVVLALHGADNSYGVSSGPHLFQRSWFDYFNSIGLTVIFPSAYDDVIQVQEYAGWYSPENFELPNRMAKIRIAQTKRSLSEIKKLYPGLPVYLWAHSAGGNAVQALDGGFEGAIIVGNPCGLGSADVNMVPSSIPLLYVWGDGDDKIFRGVKHLTAKTTRSKCGSGYASKNRRIVIASNSDHLTTIWRQEVLDAVANFFEQPRFSLKVKKTQAKPAGRSDEVFRKNYRIAPLKKAFAIGPNAYAYSESQNNQTEANFRAVFDCNLMAVGKYYPDGGEHVCGVWAEGEKISTGK